MHFKEIDIKNRVYNHNDILVTVIKLEAKNILIDEKNYEDLTIYFARYDHGKSIRMLSLYYHELIGKTMKEKIFDD